MQHIPISLNIVKMPSANRAYQTKLIQSELYESSSTLIQQVVRHK